MAGINQSIWIDKQYPSNGVTFHFLIGLSAINILNALIQVSGKFNWKDDFEITEHSREHWTAKEKGGDTTYELYAQKDRPVVPDPCSVQDMRVPETEARKPAPKQLTFI